MTDTHCHLDYLEPPELAAALEAAQGFEAMLSIGTEPARSRRNLEIAQSASKVWVAVGVHPTEAERWREYREQTLELVHHERVRAIGESGLDFYWTPQTRQAQYQALDWQAELASALKLPLILHVRSAKGDDRAEREVAEWLRRNRPPKVVLHAFGGHPALLGAGLESGAYFGFAGPLTYKKNAQLREAARQLPVECLLVETDTPFLPPEPHRGKRNQPAYVRHTLEKLAELRGLSQLEMEQITDANAQRCFGFAARG